MAMTLGLFAIAQNALNATGKAAGQRGTLNENSPLMRILQKPAVGTKVNHQSKSPLVPARHIFRFATTDFPGASFSETLAVNNGVVVGNYSFSSEAILTPFVLK